MITLAYTWFLVTAIKNRGNAEITVYPGFIFLAGIMDAITFIVIAAVVSR